MVAKSAKDNNKGPTGLNMRSQFSGLVSPLFACYLFLVDTFHFFGPQAMVVDDSEGYLVY